MTISQCNNEIHIYDIVNESGLICSVTEVQQSQKDKEPLKSRKPMLTDSDYTVSITSFRELVNQMQNNNTYLFSNVRVSTFKYQRL